MNINSLKSHWIWAKEFGTKNQIKYAWATLHNNQMRLDELFKSILKPYAFEALAKVDNTKTEQIKSPNIIWTFWWSGEETMHKIAKAGLMSLRERQNKYKVVLLDKDNIHQYVSIPQKYYDLLGKGYISVIHFCDLLRIRILRDQGGIWMDSTYFLNNLLPADIEKYVVYSARRVPDSTCNIAKGRWAGNFFCTNETNNRLFCALVELYDSYFRDHNQIITYFMLDYCIDILVQHDKMISEMINAIPYNNPMIKWLSPKIYDQFDADEWQEATKETFAFKLNWRRYNEEKSIFAGTYFKEIIEPLLLNCGNKNESMKE